MSDGEDGEGRRPTTAQATSSSASIITPASSSTSNFGPSQPPPDQDQRPEENGGSSSNSARVFSKVPIFIVEDHHDVLTFLYRCIGSRHLPLRGNTIIHFDAHPDMCIPKHMPASYVFNKEDLLDSISIENWMMPTVYAGHVERIVWIKPDWANQMPKGKFQFHVGEHEGSIRTDSTLEYFVSEGCYQSEEELENKKSLNLHVCAIEEYKVSDDDGLKAGYILDIDLDYFSTHNPFLKIYEKVGCYDKLKEIFISPELADTTENDLEKLQRIAKDREEKLEFLESIFLYLEEVGNLKHFLVDYQQEISEEYTQLLEKVSSLVAILKKEYGDDAIDWSMIYDAGCTCDVTDLPHHESTREEIHATVQLLESFLLRLPAPPTVITISRSSEDDYTPAHQVEQIQELVMEALKKCLRTELDQPILYYKDQDFKL